ncbi:unnamed protein product [Closterium sp. Yama58-4]|nr:unnamed protein product [Closterium sp. Yama58-4]
MLTPKHQQAAATRSSLPCCCRSWNLVVKAASSESINGISKITTERKPEPASLTTSMIISSSESSSMKPSSSEPER